MEITKQEWNQRKQEQDLLTQLEIEQNKGQKLRNLTDQLRNTLDDLNKSERYMSDQCTDTEFQLENLKVEVNSLSQQKEELMSQIEKVSKNLRESLAIDQVRKLLCHKCLDIVNENISNKEIIDENVVETIKEYHRESLLSSEVTNKGCFIT